MGLEFHLSVYDPDMAERKGQPASVGFSVQGLTVEQARVGVKYLEVFTRRLIEFIDNEASET